MYLDRLLGLLVLHALAVCTWCAPNFSFSGIMKNYSRVISREHGEWYVIAWDEATQRNMRHPFRTDDVLGPAPYCRVPHADELDFKVDEYPMGDVLDKFGPRDVYKKTEYSQLVKHSQNAGIVLTNKRIDYAESNLAVVPAFGGILATWRQHDQRRHDKVIFTFVDVANGYKKLRGPDWIEFRNESSGSHWPLVGEDMRLLRSPSTGKIYANWCKFHDHDGPKKLIHFYYGEVKLMKPATDYRNVQESIYVAWPPFHLTSRHESSPASEKNWPMFEYEGTLLFIKRIQPMRVVAAAENRFPSRHSDRSRSNDATNGKQMFAHSVSLTVATTNFCWNWGDLRGGTPAMLVGDEYLAFFHSMAFMNSRLVRTYFLGAYTFSAHPPFAMKRMSRYPIVIPNDWENGFTYADIDFVPFPMSYSIDDTTVTLSYGWEEGQGWVATFDRSNLFASLVPVESVVLGETDKDWDWKNKGSAHETFQYTTDWHNSCEKYGGSHNCAAIRRHKK